MFVVEVGLTWGVQVALEETAVVEEVPEEGEECRGAVIEVDEEVEGAAEAESLA